MIQFPGRVPQWTFAERARKARRDLKFTQQQMADALDVGLKRYSAWESGKNTPDDLPEMAVRFEQATGGVPRAWFLGWTDGSNPGGGPDNGSRLGESNSGPSHYNVVPLFGNSEMAAAA